jgi:hypothetical protein
MINKYLNIFLNNFLIFLFYIVSIYKEKNHKIIIKSS